LLQNQPLPRAAGFAKRSGKKLESSSIANLTITASFGVAGFDLQSAHPIDAVECADKALYFAKRSGRNRVVRWDEVLADLTFPKDESRDAAEGLGRPIPFTAVSVLSSTLYYRDPVTAEHCSRVADLCAAMAQGRLSEDERYVLEAAALLHDIGRLESRTPSSPSRRS